MSLADLIAEHFMLFIGASAIQFLFGWIVGAVMAACWYNRPRPKGIRDGSN